LEQIAPASQDKGGRLGRFLWLGILAGLPAPASPCDIALALAVDVSGSISPDEYRIQMSGLAAALRDGTVADALVKAEAQVLLVQWTGTGRQEVTLPWRALDTHDAARRMADEIETAARPWAMYSTAIGEALAFTRAQFEGVDCRRKVIDVSGDGSSNEGVEPSALRTGLWQDGYTVNALVIEGAEPDLVGYYWENVIAGEGAFVMAANGFAEYPPKIRLKILREVAQQTALLAE
jgi:Ca-activated chloride channel family protein